MTSDPTAPRRYLIVPMHPTPNGRMHIGHAAGAYLRGDVIARHLRRAGHEVSVISGTDAYENWIQLAALEADHTPAETCWRFHALIGEDLRSLGVQLDQWISPLDELHTEGYRQTHEQLLRELAARGAAVQVPDPTPRSKDTGRHVIGVWLQGVCPQCRTPGGGNACEECGYHYQPADILEPRSRLDEGPLVWEDFKSWYLTPSSVEDLVEAVGAADVAEDFAAVATAYLRQAKGRVRLSQPGDWGIPSELAGPEGVLSNPYYGFSLYCGEVHRRLHNDTHNAFDRESDVITVGLFGIDNAVGGVAASNAIALAHGGLKPFDHMVTNHFLNFEGEKVSTSRRHGIWLGELLARTSATSDELRYHLSHTALERAAGNFTAESFIESVNQVRAKLGSLGTGLTDLTGPPDAVRLEQAVAAVQEQGRHLDPGASVSLPAAVAVLDAWLAAWPADDDPGWLTGLALLAEPFMPDFAQRLWTDLGLPGRPHLGAVAAYASPALSAVPARSTRPAAHGRAAGPSPLTADEIAGVSHHRSQS
ncbi:class I tRNA ligase family protein [Streptomyces sp. NBC_00237]|uniref:class I tRNA ligase family protein n=1 Tax=Streptomyces sp. NBC_00237 TaxID=2975687 RepID=UPI00224CB7FE|nr:class I tRNA ligase family protein [Streptomyces sp. NBC_00237]MCX5205991.1 class I tRNA ligase family protein [Streptomyces sp. NBC_00237]